MPDAKYKVLDEGGLNALVSQTKANKNAAAENSAAVDGLTGDFQGLTEQMTNVLGEVEECLNQLDEVKADNDAVTEALGKKSDVGHTHSYNDLEDKPTIPAAYTLPAAGSSLGGVKSGGDVTISNGVITVNDDSHNHTIANVDGLQAALDGKAASGHTHNYAGSSSAGGAATSANKLNTNAGDANTPVYFSNGVPVACTSLDLNTSGNAATATKATQDASGNTITSTYATKTELNSVSIDCGTF